MNKLVNAFVIYKFLKLLVTPFNKTDAFKLGIIDKDGKYLKKEKELTTRKEKLASNIFTRLVWNIKKLLAKLPAGNTILGSLAAAFILLKEEVEKVGGDPSLIQEAFEEYIVENYGEEARENLLREQANQIHNDVIQERNHP